MIKVGLTGSIGMGKSTVLGIFAGFDIPVWDADEAVQRLYAKGGQAGVKIAKILPEAVQDGSVNRENLRKAIQKTPALLARINALIHPLVAASRNHFLTKQQEEGAPLCVLDIPLLFENGQEKSFDYVIVATIDDATQEKRVLARPNMTPSLFKILKERQMADTEKRARADFIVETKTLSGAKKQVEAIISAIKKKERAKSHA